MGDMGSGYAQAPEPEEERAPDATSVAGSFPSGADQLAAYLVPQYRRETLLGALALTDAPLGDVSAYVKHFDDQEQACLQARLSFPCIHIPDGVPVPIALPTDVFGQSAETMVDALFQEVGPIDYHGHYLKPYHPSEARGFFRQRLGAFLAPRIGTKTSPPGPEASFPFRVETPGRSGLRVHYSPAYFFDGHNVFGNTPSSPVDGLLPSGRYVFGAAYPPERPTWDFSAEYEVPGTPEVAWLY
jgi:hypothetical protein